MDGRSQVCEGDSARNADSPRNGESHGTWGMGVENLIRKI